MTSTILSSLKQKRKPLPMNDSPFSQLDNKRKVKKIKKLPPFSLQIPTYQISAAALRYFISGVAKTGGDSVERKKLTVQA
jgi:hypothetical protein